MLCRVYMGLHDVANGLLLLIQRSRYQKPPGVRFSGESPSPDLRFLVSSSAHHRHAWSAVGVALQLATSYEFEKCAIGQPPETLSFQG